MEKSSIKSLSLLVPVFHFLIVIILWQNMPNDGLVGKKMLFMVFPSIIISFVVTYFSYELLILIDKLAQQICFYLLVLLLSILSIFILFPCSQSFCTTDSIKEIFYLKELQNKIQIKDIFRHENQPFVQKLIIKKFRLNSYFYNVVIRDTNGITLNSYKMIFHKNNLYSDNGNLLSKIDENNLIIEDFNPNDSNTKIIYNMPTKQNTSFYRPTDNLIELHSNHLSIKVYITKEAIILNDFGFLNIVASWVLFP